MNLRISKIFFCVSAFCAALLVSCGGGTSVPQVDPTNTPVVFAFETISPNTTLKIETEVIGPDNIDQLQMIGQWGKGNDYGVALSPDETELAVSTVTGVYIYDYETLLEKQFIDLPIMINPNRRFSIGKAVSFSPDGNFLAVANDDVIIWNLVENKIERRFSNRIADYGITKIEYSPKGDSIVVLSVATHDSNDECGGSFALYSIKSGDLLYNAFFCPEAALFDFRFLDNGKIAFMGVTRDANRRGYQAFIVDATTGVLLQESKYEEGIFSISSDGSQIATGNSQTTEIIDVNTQHVVDIIDGIVIFLPNDDKRLVRLDSDWKITTGDNEEICSFESSPHINLDVYRSPFILTGDKLIFSDSWYQNIEVWDLLECKLTKQIYMPRGRNSLEYSNDGEFLAATSLFAVHLFDGKNGEYKFSIPGNDDSQPPQYYAFGKDSKTVVVVDDVDPYTISLWNLVTGKETASIPTDFTSIRYVSLSPDGKTVATIGYDGIHLWDVNNRSLLTTISGRYDNITWNPDSSNFAVLDENNIDFYNAHNGEIEKNISFPEARDSVVISKDWTYMAVINDRNQIIELWDMDGNKIRELLIYDPSIPGDAFLQTYSYQLSLDNNLLVAVRYDDENFTLRFWDTNTGEILRDVNLPFNISEIIFSPDGKKLTLLGDGVIYNLGVSTP